MLVYNKLSKFIYNRIGIYKMGGINSKGGFRASSLATLQKSLIVYNKVFYSELLTISAISFIVGFEIAEFIY
jgi:hypothetical protein